jgi:hypothetical protein
MTPITNHIDQGLQKLITRYQNKPRFAAWCASHLHQVQKIEDATQAFLAQLDVDTADETRLPLLGKIVGQPLRGTLAQYRLYIKARIATNRSRGTAPDVIRVARLLLGSVRYTEGGAHIEIEALEPIGTRDPNTSVEFLRDAKAGGVSLNLVYSTAGAADRFQFCTGLTLSPTGKGFALTGGGSGGILSAVR